MKKIIIVAILAIAAIPASAQSCCTFIYDCTKHYDSEGYYINTTCDSNLRGKTISFVWNPSTRCEYREYFLFFQHGRCDRL